MEEEERIGIDHRSTITGTRRLSSHCTSSSLSAASSVSSLLFFFNTFILLLLLLLLQCTTTTTTTTINTTRVETKTVKPLENFRGVGRVGMYLKG